MSLSSLGNTSANNAISLFSATTTQQSQLDGIATSALSRGVDAFTSGNYDSAITELKRSIGLSPYSDNALKAFQLMASAYKQQGKTADAIKAWQQAAQLFPQSDIPHSGMGDIYFAQNDYTSAEKEYSMAARLNPTVSSNVYSLGQAYMAEGRYTDAESQFIKVTHLSPQDPSGFYALGQDYHKMGRLDDAVTQLNKAIRLNASFSDARLELGMTYTDMKQTDKAQEQLNTLSNLDQSQWNQLNNYMFQESAPRLMAAYTTGGFNATLGVATQVSSIDPSLASPGSSNTFTMNFIFNKDMDPSSVQNIANWTIGRATGTDPGGPYNWGLPIQSTDANISPVPIDVTYNSDTLTASVEFNISQNASGNATIDPEHIIFKFLGLDAYGNAMDQSADQYSGISQIA